MTSKVLATCTAGVVLLGSCSFSQSERNSPEHAPAKVEDVIAQIKSDLRGVDLASLKSTEKGCGTEDDATLSLSIQGIQVSLQNTVVTDKSADVGGTKVPVFGIPVSPNVSTETKQSNGTQIDISFGRVDLPSMQQRGGKLPINPDLGKLVKGAALGIVNAAHTKPCLPVEGQPLNVTMVFELVSTDAIGMDFGFKILYSAGFKASHADDLKNTITLKLLMSGTNAIVLNKNRTKPKL